MQQDASPNDRLDLIWGMKAIAEFIGRTPQQAYHMMTTGKIPAKRVGNRWVASRKVLTRFFEEDGENGQ